MCLKVKEMISFRDLRSLMLVIFITGYAFIVSAQFAGGSGTEEDPWLIENAVQLDNLRNYLGSDHQDKHYLQIADIDLGVPPFNTGSGWNPIGSAFPGSPFWGSYDGENYSISNLTINRNSSNQGLFGYLVAVTIENVNLVDVDINGDNDVGSLAGHILRTSTIKNCYVSGDIYANQRVGGLIGKVDRTVNVSRCGSSARVTGRDNIGGIIGFFDSTNTITDCYFDGYVRGYGNNIGGIIGSSASRINRCYTNGYVTGISRVGGIAGNSGQSILYSYSNSIVTGSSRVGGIVGSISGANILESYATGLVRGVTYTGGINGIGNSNYPTENFWVPETTGQSGSSIGSPISMDMIIMRESFRNWNFDTIWTIIDGRTLPYLRWQEEPAPHNVPAPFLLTAQETDGNVILNWNSPVAGEITGYNIYRDGILLNSETVVEDTIFVDIDTGNAREYVYYVTAIMEDFGESGKSSPLFVETTLGFMGDGTAVNPYIITDHHQFNAIRHDLGANYRLGDNIDLSSFSENQGWVPIGNSSTPFTGSLDGSGYTVANLTINHRTQNDLGLFGRISEATISNLGVIDVTVSGNSNVGGLVGIGMYSSIYNSYVTGTIHTVRYTGLLAGSFSNGLIENCFTGGKVSAVNPAGMVGYLSVSTVRNSYTNASLKMTGDGIAGGITSIAIRSIIENSYSTGAIGFPGTFGFTGGLVGTYSGFVTVNNSYWNTETTGVSYSVGGGTGLTTAEMTDRSNFENWDFNLVWNIGHNDQNTYPWLRFITEPGEESYPSLIPPGRLTGSAVEEAETELTWLMPSLGNPDIYRIYKDGNLLTTVAGDVTRYVDRDIEFLTANSYFVTAVYSEEESSRSNIANATPVAGGYAGGRGSLEEPYEIHTAQQLDNVRYNPEAHYIQTADIDLLHFGSWRPIGGDAENYDRSQPFSGSFDGNGYSIENLYITDWHGYYYGLFGYLGRGGSGAVLRNINLDNLNISGYKFVGGLAGRAEHNSKIENCHVSGTVFNRAGYDSVKTGGLVGELINSEISNSSSRGSVRGRYNVGGLVGVGLSVVIKNSYSSSAVFPSDNFGDSFGGFVANVIVNSVVENSYATGPVTGGIRHTGGFVGKNFHSTLINCYSTGRVKAGEGASYVGGFAGRNHYGMAEQCYWDITLSGIDYSDLGEGRESEQMKYSFGEDTFINWDFQDVWNYDPERNLNLGYPYHRWINIEMIKDYPVIAVSPQPENESNTVPIDMQEISWIYVVDVMYENPVGFRFYFGPDPDFGYDFIWVPMTENSLYSVEDMLPEAVDYAETFYWKVVPTTHEPEFRNTISSIEDHSDNRRRRQVDTKSQRNNSRFRNDARNVPLWSFSIEKHPIPIIAVYPVPAVGTGNVPLDLRRLQWSYYIDHYHTEPNYFKVYLNETGIFDEDDDFVWVWYSTNSTEFSSSTILPERLKPYTSYYWKVVPTTYTPDYWSNRERKPTDTDRWKRSRDRRGSEAVAGSLFSFRNDAENVPIWSFRTEQGTSVDGDKPQLVTGLQMNYPNPFNPSTTISYSIGEKTYVEISVFNLKGQLVKNLVSEMQAAGSYQVIWDGEDDTGTEMSSGFYFYRLRADNVNETRKMLMIR